MTYVDHRTRSHLSPALPHLDVELTERCNNACLHCYINRPAADAAAQGRELTTAQWQDLFRQAADLGALSLRFTGGEPLLRPDFAELYLRPPPGAQGAALHQCPPGHARAGRAAGSASRPCKRSRVTVYGMTPPPTMPPPAPRRL
jgi:hypothetical protein